jgi:DnaJ-class molecular chaperone
MTTKPNENADTCEACFGTGQNSSMRSPHPTRKILYVECPICKGTGKKPKAERSLIAKDDLNSNRAGGALPLA